MMERLLDPLRKKNHLEKTSSSRLPDYRFAKKNIKEQLFDIGASVSVVIFLALFFYRNIWAFIPLSPLGVLFYKSRRRMRIRKTIELLESQFKECILSVTTSLKAGYAVENAFRESMQDMKLLYGDSSIILDELNLIKRGLELNIPLERLLMNLGERSGSECIQQFSQVFVIAKRNGGNMPEVIRNSSDLIGKQIDAKEEIRTVLSGRRLEQNIMKIMPFGIVLYIGMTNKKYFDSLYGNLSGVVIMTVCLGVYVLAYFLGEKILRKMEMEI